VGQQTRLKPGEIPMEQDNPTTWRFVCLQLGQSFGGFLWK